MSTDEIVVDPLELRVGYGASVKVSVFEDGDPFDTAHAGAGDGLEDARYHVWLRAMEKGGETYLIDVEVPKDTGHVARGTIPIIGAALERKTLRFLVVLSDEDTAPTGDTITGDFEEVLGEFTRTVQAAPDPAP